MGSTRRPTTGSTRHPPSRAVPDGGQRTLDRTLGVDWEHPPRRLLDVKVEVVYRDGTRELVEDRYLTIVDEGVVVEGHPLDAGKGVLQVEVDYNEPVPVIGRLKDFFVGLRREYRDWRRERRERKRRSGD